MVGMANQREVAGELTVSDCLIYVSRGLNRMLGGNP